MPKGELRSWDVEDAYIESLNLLDKSNADKAAIKEIIKEYNKGISK